MEATPFAALKSINKYGKYSYVSKIKPTGHSAILKIVFNYITMSNGIGLTVQSLSQSSVFDKILLEVLGI